MKRKNFPLGAPIGVFMFIANAIVLCIGFVAIVIFETHALREVTNRQTNMNLHVFAETICFFLEDEMEEADPPIANDIHAAGANSTTAKSTQNSESEAITESDLDMLVKKIAGDHPEFRITIVDSAGTVVAESSVADLSIFGNYLDRAEIAAALAGEFYSTVRKSSLNEKILTYYSMPLDLQGERYAMRVSVPASMSAFLSSNIRWQIILVAAIIFAVIAAISFAVEIQIARYIKRLETVRKNFVANVSHELKTPVTSIKGFSETLLDTPDIDADTSRHFIEIINSQSSRLVSMIDDLLALAYLEHDDKPLEMTLCNVASVVQNVCENFRENAKRKNIAINFITDACTGEGAGTGGNALEAKLNARLFEQAISNIIDNAVKYCPADSEISCSVTHTENQTIQIAVEDTGSGIPEKYRERIFERFFRVDKGRSREHGGTGLGLSITRHIVKLHGGTVVATSRLDGKSGARFVVELPTAANKL